MAGFSGDGDRLTKFAGRALDEAASRAAGRKSGAWLGKSHLSFAEKQPFDASEAKLVPVPQDGVGDLLAVDVGAIR